MSLKPADIQALIDNTVDQLIANYSERFEPAVKLDPPIPAVKLAIDKNKAREWVSQHKGFTQAIAQKILANIQAIPFPQFMQHLKAAVVAMEAHYHSEGVGDNEFIFVVPMASKQKVNSFIKSNPWVTSPALHCLHLKPAAIVSSNQLDEYLSANPGIKRVCFADDAAYSATDASVYIADLPLPTDVLIPFLTNRAQEKLAGLAGDIHLYVQQIMPTVSEIDSFTALERAYLATLPLNGTLDNHRDNNDLVLTAFAHKCADHLSAVDKVLAYGAPLDQLVITQDAMGTQMQIDEGQCPRFRKFLPTIVPPYKQDNPQKFFSEYQGQNNARIGVSVSF